MRALPLVAALSVLLVMPSAVLAGPAGVAPQAGPASFDVPPPGVTQEISLSDGTQAYGRVEQVDSGRVLFRTVDGALLEVARDRVVRLVPVLAVDDAAVDWHRHVKLVTENYAFERGSILSAGVRFLANA
jgi:hypothetical protein